MSRQDHLVAQCVQIRRVGARHHILHQSHIGDAAGERPVVQQGLARMFAIERIAAPRRLVAEHAVGRGRDADRSAAVGAVRQCRHPGRKRRAGAARRSAGAVVGIPRIAGNAPKRAVRDSRMGKFGGGRAAMHDRAGVEQPLDRRRGLIRLEILEHARAVGRDLAFDRMPILDRAGQPLEGTDLCARHIFGLGRLGLVHRAIEIGVGQRIDRRIDRINLRDLRLEHVDGGQGARLERGKRFGCAQITKIGRRDGACHGIILS
jgi:hypothetical protein